MFIVLLTLLVVAVVFIVAGLVLSPRQRVAIPTPTRTIRQTQRPLPRYGREAQYYAGRPVGINRQVRVRRSTIEVERRVFSNVFTSMNVGTLFGTSSAGQPTPWLGLGLIAIALVCFSLIILRTLAPGTAVLMGMETSAEAGVATPTVAAIVKGPMTPILPSSGAAAAIIRLGQLDPAQYNSTQDYNTWAYAACSAASMTEVLNAYDVNHKHYRIADILNVEAGLHQITPDLGLLSPSGIDVTVAHFGFKAIHLHNPTVDDMITIARAGNPVIINFPPDRWDGGHLLVLRGGDKNSVYLIDSSRLNMQVMARSTFLKYWAGFGVVLTHA